MGCIHTFLWFLLFHLPNHTLPGRHCGWHCDRVLLLLQSPGGQFRELWTGHVSILGLGDAGCCVHLDELLIYDIIWYMCVYVHIYIIIYTYMWPSIWWSPPPPEMVMVPYVSYTCIYIYIFASSVYIYIYMCVYTYVVCVGANVYTYCFALRPLDIKDQRVYCALCSKGFSVLCIVYTPFR